jgi:hypothetical protein
LGLVKNRNKELVEEDVTQNRNKVLIEEDMTPLLDRLIEIKAGKATLECL